MINISSTIKTDVSVFIGRFQPFHEGHKKVIRTALENSKYVIVLVGSVNIPRSFHNPFTFAERADMINLGMAGIGDFGRLFVLPLEDSDYNLNDWLARVNAKVEDLWSNLKDGDSSLSDNPSVSLIGHAKDSSSYYLNLFPQWGSLDVLQNIVLSATDIRKQIFGDMSIIEDRLNTEGKQWPMKDYMDTYRVLAKQQAQLFLYGQLNDIASKKNIIPQETTSFLQTFIDSEEYQTLVDEYAFVARYKYAWKDAPYAPTFVTADAVVARSGHVLLVKRRGYPGKGLWALPGGFVEQADTCEQSCLRELKEETGIKVPPSVLQGSIIAREVFDAPNRSSRGRTITHAFLIDLKNGPLPKIKTGGLSDDEETEKVAWVHISRLRREDFFEDHFSILSRLTALI